MRCLLCKRNICLFTCILIVLFQFLSTFSFAQKKIAITIDDLPSALPKISFDHSAEINNKLIDELSKRRIPAIGFVNEFMVDVRDEEEERTNILRQWVNHGLELGNHTYSHANITSGNFNEYENEIRKGEIITKKVLKERDKEIRYFRPPFLQTGGTVPEKAKLSVLLSEMNYTLAPATVESSDFVFNLIYLKAKVQDDTATMRSIANEYLKFTIKRLKFFEDVSVKVAGEVIPQIFLCHANDINADYLGELLNMFEKQGYTFISLDEALQDPFYKKADTYVGEEGISWLLRQSKVEDRERLMKSFPKVNPNIRRQYEEVEESQFMILLEERIKGLTFKTWYIFAFLGLLTVVIGLLVYSRKKSPQNLATS